MCGTMFCSMLGLSADGCRSEPAESILCDEMGCSCVPVPRFRFSLTDLALLMICDK